MIRLVEYNLTIKQNQHRQPLLSLLIVRQFVLLYCYLLLVRYAVHGETNESISSIITEQPPTINSYSLDQLNKTSTVNSATLDVNQSTSLINKQSSTVDNVITQTTLDVPSIVRSDSNQQLDYNNNTIKTPMGSPIMAFNSSGINSTSNTTNMTIMSKNQSTICDGYIFDHQQVAKFFLTTMILLGFCVLLIVILLILVAYIYRKLSKGRNVKVWFNK